MLYLASDHAGFELKEVLKKYLLEIGFDVKDMGNFVYDENDDYPDWIVLGGSGQGEAIVANRVPGIRAAVLYNYNEDIIKLSREHNDANILSLGARFISEEDAKKAVKAWIETEFSREERHQRRIEKF